MIRFKKKYFQKIKDKEKKSTIRLKANCKINDIIKLNCGKESINAKIIKIECININDINEDILMKEKFKSKEKLVEALNDCYPNEKIENMVYIEWK